MDFRNRFLWGAVKCFQNHKCSQAKHNLLEDCKAVMWHFSTGLWIWQNHPDKEILTIVIIVKNDEFLPGIFGDHSQDDIIQVDRGPHGQRVVVIAVAPGEPTAAPWRSCRGALDEEVRDVHGIGQRLQGSCWCAANGADEGQDALVHQVAGCKKTEVSRVRAAQWAQSILLLKHFGSWKTAGPIQENMGTVFIFINPHQNHRASLVTWRCLVV